MVDPRVRNPGRLLLAVLLVVVPLGLLTARVFAFPGDRVTVGAVAGGVLLVICALVLPALILSGWQSTEE